MNSLFGSFSRGERQAPACSGKAVLYLLFVSHRKGTKRAVSLVRFSTDKREKRTVSLVLSPVEKEHKNLFNISPNKASLRSNEPKIKLPPPGVPGPACAAFRHPRRGCISRPYLLDHNPERKKYEKRKSVFRFGLSAEIYTKMGTDAQLRPGNTCTALI